MSKNIIISLVVIALVIVGAAFYGGMKYGQNNKSQVVSGSFSQRTGGQFGTSTQRGNRSLGGLVIGQIIAVDNNSITIKAQDGGSRIVFLSASTTVSHMTTGTIGDLIIGSNVSVNGTTNTDNNSISAQTIQIRPAAPVQLK